MPRRYRSLNDLTKEQRRRMSSVLVGPILLWVVGPSSLMGVLIAGIIEARTDAATDTRSWSWIAKIAVSTFVCGMLAGMTGLVLLMRHLLRYRTKRRGRLN